jgi:hypothetical protein
LYSDDCKQLEDDVLDILADIAGLGQRGGVGHGEGHVEDARQRLRQQRLAAARRPDQQDVRLRQFDVGRFAGVVQALVVVVHRDREHALGMPGRSRNRRERRRSPCGVGTPSVDFRPETFVSSRMMSMHSSTHSSQMNTVGPAISLRTSCWLLPQNEQ